VTTLDVLSGGRMTLGVGAGMRSTEAALAHEAGGLGLPFLSLADRFGQLEEVVRLALQMWRGEEEPFDGRHYRLARPLNSPNSLQRPHPPIMIGGGGERVTLRLVARYADACNLFDLPGQFQDDIPHKLRVLAEHCRREGRDYGEIEKTTATFVDLSGDRREALDRLLAHLRELAAMGIDHAIVGPREPWDEESLDALASVVGEIHAIPVERAAA
jgi:alkanesulfonate monooxygenase SsuD/methylene tetrahydromethanopterin reductase-like flavin-dependent oxidoreductase (luciferase family)